MVRGEPRREEVIYLRKKIRERQLGDEEGCVEEKANAGTRSSAFSGQVRQGLWQQPQEQFAAKKKADPNRATKKLGKSKGPSRITRRKKETRLQATGGDELSAIADIKVCNGRGRGLVHT